MAQGHTLISQLIAAGEFPIGNRLRASDRVDEEGGRAGEWAKTSNPIFVALSPTGLAAKAPHPMRESCCSILCFPTNRSSNCAAPIVCRAGRYRALVPEMHHSKLKLAAIDPKVSDDINRHAKEFTRIYFR